MLSKTVVVADVQPLFAMGLSEALKERGGFSVVARCNDGHAALAMIRDLRPTLAILGSHLPRVSRADVILTLHALGIETRCVFLIEPGVKEMPRSAAPYVWGVLSRASSPEEVVACLSSAVSRRTCVEPLVSSSASARSWNLTAREGEIATLVLRGRANKEIARTLKLSEGTVKVHLHNTFRKMGVRNRTELTYQMRLEHWPASGLIEGGVS